MNFKIKLLFLLSCRIFVFGQLFPGDPCELKNSRINGVCMFLERCHTVINDIAHQKQHGRCGFDGSREIVCCPHSKEFHSSISTTTTTKAPFVSYSARISEIKCNEYKSYAYETLSVSTLGIDEEPSKIPIDKCGHKVIPLIVNGQYSQPREFPHMALLGYLNSNSNNEIVWLCGGSLISEQYVLTAAHCLNSRTFGKPKVVRLGELDISTNTDDAAPEDFEIASRIRHPRYNGLTKYHDIALLKLARKVKFNSYKRPACLPTTFQQGKSNFIATGWGYIEFSGPTSDILQKVTLEEYSHTECNEIYFRSMSRNSRGISEQTQLCAGSKTSKNDTCQGDSGGPLQVFHPEHYCMYFLVGVTSFGKGCGFPGVPAVYTRIFPYLTWIELVVWGNNSGRGA